MSVNINRNGQKRVVIVGGGLGGLRLANQLKDSNLQVVLIDKNNYHQFPPTDLSGGFGRTGSQFHLLPLPTDLPQAKELLFPHG